LSLARWETPARPVDLGFARSKHWVSDEGDCSAAGNNVDFTGPLRVRPPTSWRSPTRRSGKGLHIGYLRVSALDQSELRQLEGLELDKTFTDKASGKDTKRPNLELLLSFIREGHTLVCHSMDRLARNLDDLRKLVLDLTKRGVHVRFVKENLTFTGEDSPMANLLLSVMGAFAQFERELIRERQREGIVLPPCQHS